MITPAFLDVEEDDFDQGFSWFLLSGHFSGLVFLFSDAASAAAVTKEQYKEHGQHQEW